MKSFLSICVILFCLQLYAQTVYKTPSGTKYHTAQCRYVKNVSHKMSVTEAQEKGLSPCSQCNPHANSYAQNSSHSLGIKPSELKGAKGTSTQCKGKTKKGLRCKNKTRNKNGYCHKHEP